MVKYLLLALVVIWLFYSPALRRKSQPNKPAQPVPPQPSTPGREVSTMVRCSHCGLHLPSDEAVHDAQGHSYCGEAHRQAGPAAS